MADISVGLGYTIKIKSDTYNTIMAWYLPQTVRIEGLIDSEISLSFIKNTLYRHCIEDT